MTSKAQRKTIIGLETTPGTAVTPDVAIRATVELAPVAEKTVVEEDIGSFAPSRHYVGAVHAEGSMEQDGIYQQVPYVIAMAMGQVTPSGAASPYTWRWGLPDTTAPTFATFTVEYTDGDKWVTKADDVFATSLEVSGESGKTWMFNADLVGAEVSFPGALSASLSAPATTSPIRMADTTLYIDGSYSGIGTTSVDNALISFSHKVENLQHQKQFAGSLYPNGRGNDRWMATLDLTLEVDNAQVQNLQTYIDATDTVAVRLRAVDPVTSYVSQIDGNYFLNELESLDDRDGNNIVNLTFLGQKDASNNSGGYEVQCDLSSL